MTVRGVHFAITPEDMARLMATDDDAGLMEIVEAIETAWDIEYLAESDKAWNAIHRCLTDGSLLYESGEYPLNRVICGGQQLHQGDDYTVSLVTPAEVMDVAMVLEPLGEEWLKERYFTLINPKDYGPEYGEDDFAYTWGWFQDVRNLYRKAAAEGRAVIFTVDA